MSTTSVPRRIAVERTSPGRFRAANERGGRISFGTGDQPEFTPTELLLAAIGGCTAIDVEILTSRRAQPDSFAIEVAADKIRDDGGNRLTDIVVTFRIGFPSVEQVPAARAARSRTSGFGRRGMLPTGSFHPPLWWTRLPVDSNPVRNGRIFATSRQASVPPIERSRRCPTLTRYRAPACILERRLAAERIGSGP